MHKLSDAHVDHPSPSKDSDHWGKVAGGILSAGNSISQNCILRLGHERDGTAMAIIIAVPGHGACLWSTARAGQEGRRWAVESPHPWVGSTTWASLIGGRPSAWYVGMQGAPSNANVGGFKIDRSRRLWNKCSHPHYPCTLGYHWTTKLDFPVLPVVKTVQLTHCSSKTAVS